MIQDKFNDLELKKYFGKLYRHISIKCCFLNKAWHHVLAFSPNSALTLLGDQAILEMFLIETEGEMFKFLKILYNILTFPMRKWKSQRCLLDGGSIIIEKADKGSCVIVWCRVDYLSEMEKQLVDGQVYKGAMFNELCQ